MNINNLNPVSKSVLKNVNLKHWLVAPVIAASLTLVGCGNSESTDNVSLNEDEQVQVDNGSTDNSASIEEGSLMIAITDAEEDFLSYTIGINSILLTRANGDQVEVLSEASQVDFVDYQELTELFSIVKAPVGTYQSIVMSLDYSEAYLLIQDEEGNSYEAQAVDDTGTIVTTHVVEFRLAEGEELEVTAKDISALTLDLDLSASNTILSFSPAQVEVQPFVIGDVSLDSDREHRLRGTLAAVDAESQQITLNVKPMRKKQGQFGELAIELSDETSIEIDGELVDVSTAISSLQQQDENYPVVAYGHISQSEGEEDKVFTATSLLAGSSVPWAGKDVFKGMITALEEGVVYLSGVSVDTDTMEKEKVQGYELVVSDSTEYVSHLTDLADSSYLVPGQRLEIVGQLEVENEVGQFNASDEVVRIVRSSALGEVVAITEDDMVTLEVSRFNKRPARVVRAHNKKKQPNIPSNAEELSQILVDISDFSQTEGEVGGWIKVTGVVSPDSEVEGESDIVPLAVVNYEVSETELSYMSFWGRSGGVISWSEESNAVSVDLAEGQHKMNFRFSKENQLPEISTLNIVSADEVKHFALRQKGEQTQFFDSLAELAQAVVTEQESGETVNGVAGKGWLNEENQLVVNSLVIKLN